jgi:hypothetical protein
MTNDVKTPEQIEAQQIEFATQQAASTRFMRRCPEYKTGVANADKLAAYIKKDGLEWTTENLQRLFEEHKADFELNPPYTPPKPKPAPEIEEKLPAWGRLTNRVDVDAIPRMQYRAWLKNPEFVKDVNAALRGAK